MVYEIIAVGLVSLLALRLAPKGRPRLYILLALALGVCATSIMRTPDRVNGLAHFRPLDSILDENDAYTSSRSCRPCHPGAYESWNRSYHRRMTQAALPETVLAPFDGRTLTNEGREYRVFEDDGVFFVDMPEYQTRGDSPNERVVRPVVMTTGSHNMQAYWLPVPWFDEAVDPEARRAFNVACAACHGTDGEGAEQVPLIDGELNIEELRRNLDGPQHPPVDEELRTAALSFAAGIQHSSRLMQFPFVYLVKLGRWAHEEHTFLQPAPPREATEPYGDQWSNGCDQCHSVRAQFEKFPQKRVGEAAVAELGIACEVCHGAGRVHAERHRSPGQRYIAHLSDKVEDDIIHPGKLDHRRASEICAQCHAELIMKEGLDKFSPGKDLGEFAHWLQYITRDQPRWLKEAIRDEPDLLASSFWRDGTIRIAGRDFNGLAITGCYTKGTMSCLSCHSMHSSDPNDQLREKAKGDGVCSDCHPSEGSNITAHTHHPEDSEGSRCYNCHMPHTTAGLLTLMRAHRVDSPNAITALRTGRPTACNLCHIDKTLQEVSENLTKWYGHADLGDEATNLDTSAMVVHLLKGDAVQRATAAWHLGWAPALTASGNDWQAPFLAELLDDPYSVVRAIAYRALSKLPDFAQFDYDYTAPPSVRRDAVQRVVNQWQSTHEVKPDRPHICIKNGRIERNRISRLKARRDDTPIRVNE